MRLDQATCRARLTAARHAYLATAGTDAQPHVVPVTFALLPGPVPDTDEIVTAVDHKPKTTTRLRRLRNIADNPRVAVLTDHYDDDWTRLWWVRADGIATVERDGAARETALDALAHRYPQYLADRPRGAVVRIRITRWTGWSATRPR